MLTGAMQSMFENVLKDFASNLPPDMREKIGHSLQFIATVEARLSSIENDLQAIKTALGVDPKSLPQQQKVLTDERSKTTG